MIISQEESKFEPITIILETRDEAKSFRSLIQRIERWRSSDCIPNEEYEIVRVISDAYTTYHFDK